MSSNKISTQLLLTWPRNLAQFEFLLSSVHTCLWRTLSQ